MKNFFVTIFCISVGLMPALAQGTDTVRYQIEQDILYRSEADGPLDDYMLERCRLDLYYPANLTDFPTVVYFHGGGLTAGNKYFPKELMKEGVAVVTANYRLSPKAKNPAYIDDAAAAVAWTFKNIARYGGDISKIFITGHSAGGYLTSIIGLDRSWLEKYSIDADRIAGLMPASGQAVTHFTIREERGLSRLQPIIDEYAPLGHLRADAPPIILITGDRNMEIPGRYEENALLYAMLKEAGDEDVVIHELAGFNHVEMIDPALLLVLKHLRKILEEQN